jgi:transcriptional antiterminator
MSYSVMKVLNNNAIQAKEDDSKQVVLISKGIGFKYKAGCCIEDVEDDIKIYYIKDDKMSASQILKLSYDIEKVRKVTYEIQQLAREELQITNENLYEALFDHIAFAIERLRLGVPIENPFITEIRILCNKEYVIADKAGDMISKLLNVEINEDEKGFIALHLYSAKRGRHVNNAMRDVRLYKEILELVGHRHGFEVRAESVSCQGFLVTLNRLLVTEFHKKMLNMPVIQHVRLNMYKYYETTLMIEELIKNDELDISLSESSKAFLSVAICQYEQFEKMQK